MLSLAKAAIDLNDLVLNIYSTILEGVIAYALNSGGLVLGRAMELVVMPKGSYDNNEL